jgi:hypothetical protein
MYKLSRTNKFIALTQQGSCRNEALKEIMDVVKRGQTSLRKTIKRFWHMLLTFIFNHLNG